MDLQRASINGFALPLGIAPVDGDFNFEAPSQGYTVAYTPGEEDEPDTYAFHVVVSHEKLKPILHEAFELLPNEVFAIIEIGSRDAYRATDVYIGENLISYEHFREIWSRYEPFLLEDGSIAAGANSEDPFIEIFLDQWKGLSLHVPLAMREQVEGLLHRFGLEEVQETWPPADEHAAMEVSHIRPVLDIQDEFSPDVDELLLQLRHDWQLELNIDPQSNLDDAGRNLGATLWHAVVIVDDARDNSERGAYASVWATAASMADMELLIQKALVPYRAQWRFGEIYTIDRVAFDERPDQLAELRPNQREPKVHLVTIEPWDGPPPALETKSTEDIE